MTSPIPQRIAAVIQLYEQDAARLRGGSPFDQVAALLCMLVSIMLQVFLEHAEAALANIEAAARRPTPVEADAPSAAPASDRRRAQRSVAVSQPKSSVGLSPAASPATARTPWPATGRASTPACAESLARIPDRTRKSMPITRIFARRIRSA